MVSFGGKVAYVGFFLWLISVGCVTSINWYKEEWCGGDLQYLDDSKCVKIFPEKFARDWHCEVPIRSQPSAGYGKESTLDSVKVDTYTLGDLIPDPQVNLCVIATQRVKQASGEVALFHKYLCAGERSTQTGYETWSSSKIFAIANAAGHLRTNESTAKTSALYGIDGSVTGKHGVTPLGDLSTVVSSYDHTAGYSSNSLSSYFHDIGWRDRLNGLVNSTTNNWLGRTAGASAQTLGGNYGEATPADLTFDVTAATASSTSPPVIAADKDPWPTKHDNTISALTEVELLRRIVQHRETQESMRFPGAEWADIQAILYGAERSLLFPGLRWGGMTADPAIFLQTALDLESYLSKVTTHGNWRVFSKLGAGFSNSRYMGEIVSNAYTCLPSYDANGVSTGGIEFSITARGSVPNDSSLKKVQTAVLDAMTTAVKYLMENEVQA